jgi:GAF domain-containing protein
MPPPPKPFNETERYAALMSHRLTQGVLGDAKTERLVMAAAERFSVPQAAVALVAQTQVYFVAQFGIGFHSMPRDISFCGYAIHSRSPLIVEDATKDARFADNPLVTAGPLARFYAGVPLVDDEGYCLGTFCTVDTRPRSLTAEQISELVGFSLRAMQRVDFLTTIAAMSADRQILR